MLRSDAGIIQARGHRVRFLNLPVLILQQHREATLQYAGRAVGERSSVLSQAAAGATRFDAEHFHIAIFDEWMEHSDRVRAAADARDHQVRQLAGALEHLYARFAADHRLQLTHDVWIRM